jgi:hypothetical protein
VAAIVQPRFQRPICRSVDATKAGIMEGALLFLRLQVVDSGAEVREELARIDSTITTITILVFCFCLTTLDMIVRILLPCA